MAISPSGERLCKMVVIPSRGANPAPRPELSVVGHSRRFYRAYGGSGLPPIIDGCAGIVGGQFSANKRHPPNTPLAAAVDPPTSLLGPRSPLYPVIL